jgi:peptidoglycan hydrolase-like protein with peptidoglycan-binding domain
VRGSLGPAVTELQRRLNAAGAAPRLAEDGDFGPLTEAAVRAFQARSGLAVDGIVGRATVGALDRRTGQGQGPEAPGTVPGGAGAGTGSGAGGVGTGGGGRGSALDAVRAGRVLLEPGAEGPAVLELQRRLNAAGASPRLAEDGDFGPRTEDAVRSFQARAGIAADGVVGPQTMAALDRARAPGPAPTAPARPPAPTAPVGPAGPTPYGRVAARDLTNAQALAELQALSRAGVRYDVGRDGRVVLDLPVRGVDFRYAGSPVGRPDGQTYALDPRMAVATVRLAEWARSRGVTEVEHRGFAGGAGSTRHNQGRALDIAGFRGVDPASGRRFHHDVQRDWGNLPDRRGSTTRLDPGTASGRFFTDAYAYFTTQFRDRPGTPSRPGDTGPTYIVTPDHRDPGLASSHSNHYHIELPPGPGQWD